MKKATALVLVIVLAFSCFAVTGFAAPKMTDMKIISYPLRTVFYKGIDWKYGYWNFSADSEDGLGTFTDRDGLVCFMHNGGYYSYYEDLGMIDMTGLVLEVSYSDGSKKTFEYKETKKGITVTQNIYASPQKKMGVGKNTIDVYFKNDISVYTHYDIELRDTAPVRGDINDDTRVNSADALRVLQYVVGMIKLSDFHINASDLTKDGKVNSADALDILLISVGKKK